MKARREILIPAAAAGRLDRALADALGVGRAAIKAAFAAGAVRVEGRRAQGSDQATPGAHVQLELEDRAGPPRAEPGAPLVVLAESPRWIVVDKPAGVATHPLREGESGTLANAVAARHPECAAASPDPREGGAVQRLDLETSGCVLFARDRGAWEALRAELAGRRVEKVYTALVLGRVTSGGVLSVSLAQRGVRTVVVADALAEERLRSKGAGRARPAETHYEVLRSFPDHTLLSVRIVTGVMHQIRAHLAHLGHPVAGDVLYGGAAAALPGLERHFLHASRLAFDAPEGGRAAAESPLPRDLGDALAAL